METYYDLEKKKEYFIESAYDENMRQEYMKLKEKRKGDTKNNK